MDDDNERNSNSDDPMEEWSFIPKTIEIPEEFHSLELGGPFEKCMICEAPLYGPSSNYMIERIFRGTEPIVEYAICLPCQQEMSMEMSVESRQQVMQLFQAIDYEARARKLSNHLDDSEPTAWLDECFLTGKPKHECYGYQIIAQCSNFEMELGMLPIMLSDEAAKQIAASLSQKTRGFMDDFMDRFGMPPEFSADPEWTPIFL